MLVFSSIALAVSVLSGFPHELIDMVSATDRVTRTPVTVSSSMPGTQFAVASFRKVI